MSRNCCIVTPCFFIAARSFARLLLKYCWTSLVIAWSMSFGVTTIPSFLPCCSSSVFWIRYATTFWTPASYSAEPFFGTGCLLTTKVALRYSCISSSNDACEIGWPLISATLPFGTPDELLDESPHAATSITTAAQHATRTTR